MNVEVLTIGDELLLGFTIDTNAAFMARALADEGIVITHRATVGDDAASIARGVREALDRTGAVITTGGLGPTSDDMTKPAIAALFGREMRRDESIVEALRKRWRDRGWPGELPKANEQQGDIPDGARVLTNNHGSAPGIWLEDQAGRWVAMLPGVPREMRGMLLDTILPILRERGGAGTVVRSRTLRTTGISESSLADALAGHASGVEGLPIAYLPGWEGVDLRLTVRHVLPAEADAVLDRGIAALRAVAADHAYGEGNDDLASIIVERCRARAIRLAVAESCTGGMLGSRITAVPGSSDVFLGGVIAYDNLVKSKLLGIRASDIHDHGAVSEFVARAMATNVKRILGSDVGLAITGVAGPGGGTEDKPVGTVWIAADLGGDVRARSARLIGDRQEIRQRATQIALDMVRRGVSRSRATV